MNDHLKICKIIEAIPMIVKDFKGGVPIEILADSYKCDRLVIESVIRLAFHDVVILVSQDSEDVDE